MVDKLPFSYLENSQKIPNLSLETLSVVCKLLYRLGYDINVILSFNNQTRKRKFLRTNDLRSDLVFVKKGHVSIYSIFSVLFAKYTFQ